MNEKLVVGGRIKLYFSGANANSTKNSGFIYTTNGTADENIYYQAISSDLELQTSGIAAFTKDEYDGNIANDLIYNTFFNGSLGLGFDAGFTYYYKKNLQFTASIIDVGFIRHTKDIETLTYKGNYEYNGINPGFDLTDNPENILDDFSKAIPRDTIYSKYTTWRPAKFNTSVEYSFGESRFDDDECSCKAPNERLYVNAIGGQFFAMTMPKSPFVALTAFYKRRLFRKLELKTTYTVDSFSYKNIGLGVAGTWGKVNMYLLVDNVLEYKDITKANSAAFQLGINFVFQDSD